MVGIETKYKKVYTSGKRKSAVAKAAIQNGAGKVTVNGRGYETLQLFNKLKISEPLKIAEQVLGKIDFDCKITAKGGGEIGQIDASRLALAKAILEYTKSKELEAAYADYDKGLLVADARRKETRKPGTSKARAMRQTSYR